ncbi:MAG: S1 RNA-binding domain-containing protein, partial [Nitrospirae bacterium]|nr:S1 RNA-binding domain-containing protein [Nitrospirota bacterium]
VDISGTKAFLPLSHVDVRSVHNIDSLIGQVVPLKILKLIPPRRVDKRIDKRVDAHRQTESSLNREATVIVSRRASVAEERDKKKADIFNLLKEGSLIEGVVKNIADFGVFVDIGGVDGLLHISDISWRRVKHPSEFFSIGDKGDFIVLKLDAASGKITLGYKQKNPDPWLIIEEKYSPAMTVKGRVINITDFGVFVEIEEGLEGLVHRSELDWASMPKHPSKYVSLGEEVEALITDVNKKERKLALSLKQLKIKPWDLVAQRYKKDDKINGKVRSITDFGAFVRLPEGVDGLIHISDLSWTKRIKHPSDVIKKGRRIEALVLGIEPEKEKMSLGIKQLRPDPWIEEIPAKFKTGDEITGRALRINDFGIFVEIADLGDNEAVEGLVYASEIDSSREVKEGDEIRVRVIKVNPEEKKIGLSMKNIKEPTEETPS